MAKVCVTKNYAMFQMGSDNRDLNLDAHRRLVMSMKKHGFLQCFPVVVSKERREGKMIIKDGQHRFAVAQMLGLPIYWIEDDSDFDVAEINATNKSWRLVDYVKRHADHGNRACRELLEFAQMHGLCVSTAYTLLSGNTCFNRTKSIQNGTFTIKDRDTADKVAVIYKAFTAASKAVKNSRFVEACIAACRVPGFDYLRLIKNVQRCHEKLHPYSTRDAYLDMIEEVYNFGRRELVPIKLPAMQAMRDRNPINRGQQTCNAAVA